jgi:16S rRNA (cytidine1402-2'-O)-methyltransferase
MSKAKIYLIPNFLGAEVPIDSSFPKENIKIIEALSHFAIENIKDTRRFLVRIGLKQKIDSSEFYTLDKRSEIVEIQPILDALKNGNSVGIISDAGCPGIADPGSLLVAEAHKNNIPVVPLIGPSSILLALMASGFNGQSFAFNGYLNRDKLIRVRELKEMESLSQKTNQTQIFMETPYRNDALWEDLLKNLNPTTKLCIAANISTTQEFIKTKNVSDWRKSNKVNLSKIPAIFLLSV